MKKETLLHSKKIQKMITQYKHDMQLVDQLTADAAPHYEIEQELYVKHEVKRGLRDLDGKGVRAGLTTISKVSATQMVDGREVPAPGQLLYRGIPIEELVQGFITHDRFGFEEIVYLLLMGHLPQEEQLRQFKGLLADYQELPNHFNSGVIMKMPSDNIMNTMAKCVLALHAYDPKPDDTSLPNVMRQCIQLVAQFPSLAVFGYQASMYFRNDKSMLIRNPDPNLSIAENILYMMRRTANTPVWRQNFWISAWCCTQNTAAATTLPLRYTWSPPPERILFYHCGGAGFAEGTETRRRKHQGHGNVRGSEKALSRLDGRGRTPGISPGLLRGEGFDHSGLIYGMGHAVYSVSDPRAVILKSFVEQLSNEKGCHDEYQLYASVERLAKEVITQNRKIYKGVCANVDFYSGFVYRMLGLPMDLFTPIFAIARIAGWSAHRLEELINCRKIIRPAYLSVAEPQEYVPLEER